MAARGKRVMHVVPAVPTDRWGDPAPGPASEPFDVKGCHVLPKYSREAETIVTGYRVICNGSRADLERATKIKADATITLNGSTRVWEVDGEPGPYERGTRVRAVEVHLKAVGVGPTT